MGKGTHRWHYLFIALYALVLAAMILRMDLHVRNPWGLPAVLALFFFSYWFDVRFPGSTSRMSLDYAIAMPAMVLLQNPLLTGLLAGAGLLLNRLATRGARGVKPVNVVDALNIAVSFTLSGLLLLKVSVRLSSGSPLWIVCLFAGMVAFALMNLVGYLLDRGATGLAIRPRWVGGYLAQTTLWLILSAPITTLTVMEILEGDFLQVALSALPLLVIVWTLHLNARMEEKNSALALATRRQEFLEQLTMTTAGSLENASFLRSLLQGLREFVPWDREVLLVLPAVNMEGPVLHSLGELPKDPQAAQKVLASMLEAATHRAHQISSGVHAVRPLLNPDAKSQVIVPMATREVAFGLLVAERLGPEPFLESDAAFLEMAFAQLAGRIQDEILKKQLLSTNRRLMHQADYLAQILQISNLLRVHLDVQGILEKVATGIREGIGFDMVLISLYHEQEGHFERIAQAGMGDRWEEVRQARPPASAILSLMQEKYRAGNCYLIRHGETERSPYDILPADPRPAKEPDDWDPMDALVVPLKDKDDRLLGVISVDGPADGKVPTMESLRALEVLANQTVHALESAQVHARIRRQAIVDALTGLHNHGYFQETLAARAREHAEKHQPYAVLMMDLDNFKEINDTYGHLAGDAVLRAVADALTASIRKEDVAARYGGEEFAVFLPQRTAEQAALVAERIRSAVDLIRESVPDVPGGLAVTASIGLAAYPQDGEDHHRLLEKADLALYRAKREGKNRVCVVA